MSQYHTLLTAPFYFLSKSIREGGGNAFHKAHGRDLFDFASVYPEINKVFNDGMECTARITIKALISEYKHGLDSIGSPVDVGDGRGAAISKSILHDWSDEDCVKVLKNCRRSIPEKIGKVVIVDVVFQPCGDDLFDNTSMAMDLVMFMVCEGEKERTELEWKKILGGFPCHNTVKIPDLQSIIEAYPQ
ncbi:hypothetical protein ACSBR1_028073 [Camellia fascicularis]